MVMLAPMATILFPLSTALDLACVLKAIHGVWPRTLSVKAEPPSSGSRASEHVLYLQLVLYRE